MIKQGSEEARENESQTPERIGEDEVRSICDDEGEGWISDDQV